MEGLHDLPDERPRPERQPVLDEEQEGGHLIPAPQRGPARGEPPPEADRQHQHAEVVPLPIHLHDVQAGWLVRRQPGRHPIATIEVQEGRALD